MDRFSVEVVPGGPPDLSGLEEGAPWFDGDDNVSARIYRDTLTHWIDWTGLGVFAASRDASSIRVWPRDSSNAIAAIEHARERLPALLMQTRSCQVLHAAAVGIKGQAIAIAGASGNGKSTLAFALSQRGHRHLADDAVVIRLIDGCPYVVCFPFRPQLRGASASMSAGHPQVVHGSDEPVPLGAVILLSQSANATGCSVERITGPGAWTALTAHAHAFDERDRDVRASIVDAFAKVTSVAPIFRLTYQPRFESLTALASIVEDTCMGVRP